MATIAMTESTVEGNKRKTRGTIAFDSSYPDGGEAFTARQLGLAVVETLIVHPRLGIVFEPDLPALKIKALVPGVTVGAAGAVTVDDFPVAVGVPPGASAFSIGLGTGSATHRFGAMPEVADTATLATITGARWEATGV